MDNMKLFSCVLLFVLLISSVSAIISINSGGSESTIVSSDKVIEGFPFLKRSVGGGPGGVPVYKAPVVIEEDEIDLICSLLDDYINRNVNDEGDLIIDLELLEPELLKVNEKVKKDIDLKDLRDILLTECYKPSLIRPNLFILSILLFTLIMIIIAAFHRRNLYKYFLGYKVKE